MTFNFKFGLKLHLCTNKNHLKHLLQHCANYAIYIGRKKDSINTNIGFNYA